MSEIVMGLLAALASVLGAFLYGRSRYQSGMRSGAEEERRRTQTLTKAMADQLNRRDNLVRLQIEQRRRREVEQLRLDLNHEPTPERVQDLLGESERLGT